MFNKQVVLEQAKCYDSFYLYEENTIIEHTQRLKQNFRGIEFLYSLKANPHPEVIASIFAQGFGADAASIAEVQLSVQHNLPADKILYSAPGKSVKDIETALDICTIIADSVDEVERIQHIAEQKGMLAEIGIRINPDFTFDGGLSGAPSKFGIDEELVYQYLSHWQNLPNIKIIGIHTHLRSQELNTAVLENYYIKIFKWAIDFQQVLGNKLKFINLGSGIGITYELTDKDVDINALSGTVARLQNKLRMELAGTVLFIETGRYAVGKSGVYVTKVLDKKQSYGKTFVILSNTFNGFIRPSMSQLVQAYTPDNCPPSGEPLFTSKNAFEFIPLTDSVEQETVTLVGNLCTAIDVIAKDITLPKLQADDLIVITNAGSYAAVISPMQFSLQTPPAQLFLTHDGQIINPNK